MQQANKEQVGVPRMEDAPEHGQIVIFRHDVLRPEEWERHLIARAVDDAVYPLAAAIGEDNAIAIKSLDIRLGLDAAMRNAIENLPN